MCCGPTDGLKGEETDEDCEGGVEVAPAEEETCCELEMEREGEEGEGEGS